MNSVMTFNNVSNNMFNKDPNQVNNTSTPNNNTIILPLPKLNSPSNSKISLTNQNHPQPIHPQHPHNSLWDYKFGSTPTNTTVNSPSPSPSIEAGILNSNPISSSSSTTTTTTTAHYTLHTPIPHQPALLLPSINSLPTSTTYSPIEEPHQIQYPSLLKHPHTHDLSSNSNPTSRSHSLPINHHSSLTPNKIIKPQRKKKQCPECKLFFSNLSTHKSIHLNPENRPYLCKICGRGFARSNDLFRHNKRHWKETGSSQGAFKCPFSTVLYNQVHDHDHDHGHHEDESIDSEDDLDQTPCHPTGIFSRCDTYKNHLKALHFIYPPGTKKKQRNEVGGNCKKCGEWFENVDIWLSDHIENNQCGWSFE